MKPNRHSYFATKLTRLSACSTTNAAEHATAAVGNRRSLRLAGLLSLSAITLFGSHGAQAASATWTGGTSNVWATASNWSANPVPGTGDTATFSGASGNTTVSPGTITINTILFDTSSAAAYTLGTSVGTGPITLNDSGAITVTSSVVNNQLINANLVLGTTSGTAGYFLTNNSGTNGQVLTIAGNLSSGQSNTNNTIKTLTLNGSASGLVTGVISGNGSGNGQSKTATLSLLKSGTGTWTLSNANTYTGVTTLTAGTVSVGTIGNGGIAGNLGQSTNAATNLVFDGGALRYTGATASTNRNFTINTNKVATFEVTANNLTISGASTSTNGGLTKAGAGILTLTGNNLHTGDTIIKAGTLKLDGSGSIASTKIIVGDTGSTGAVLDATTKTGGFIVASGKTVGGIGTIQGSTTIQGILAPGNSAGVLSNLGNIDLQSSSTFQMEIGGTTAGTGYDQLNVTGGVTLAGALNVTMLSPFVPANGNLFFLIANDGTEAISGKFSNANVNDTTVVNLGGRQWLISYKADFGSNAFSTLTGNDVALMAVPEPNAALIGGVGVLLLLRRRRA